MNYVFLSLDIATARRFSSHFIILGYRILFSVNFQWYEFFFALAKSQNNFTFSHQNIFQNFTVIKSYAPCFCLHFISFRIPKDMILYQFDQRKFYLHAKSVFFGANF